MKNISFMAVFVAINIFIFHIAIEAIFISRAEINKMENNSSTFPSEIVILETWELPANLKEISGISYLDEKRFACIQDEKGVIYIYNAADNKIEREISFTDRGDFEGITVKGNTAYVVRADGMLFEIDMKSQRIHKYKTGLTEVENVEGLCFDVNNEHLLLSVKDNDPGLPKYKGIYAFDLQRKKLLKDPVYKIDLQNKLFNNAKEKSVRPSEIGIHPLTKEIYTLDGPESRLIIMDKKSRIKNLLHLGEKFYQPEGITFSPAGEIFISNEGQNKPANIIKVALK